MKCTIDILFKYKPDVSLLLIIVINKNSSIDFLYYIKNSSNYFLSAANKTLEKAKVCFLYCQKLYKLKGKDEISKVLVSNK